MKTVPAHGWRRCHRYQLVVASLMAVCIHGASCTADVAADLEALAWDFRFQPAVAHESPLVSPLQRTLARMKAHAASAGPDAFGDATTGRGGFCVDECGAVERLSFWGRRVEGVPPEFWSASVPRDRAELYDGEACRLRRALQPLYDACLNVRDDGSAWWHDHLGYFWRGMNTSSCVVAAQSQRRGVSDSRGDSHIDELSKRAAVCHDDAGDFSEHDLRWLSLARPIAAQELGGLQHGTVLAAQAATGAAPSLDRLLLLLARLVCLSMDDGADSTVGGSAMASLQVLVVGAGPVGLMTAVQSRLAGATVTVWEKRRLYPRTRENVVDSSESDRSEPTHPAALTLMENIGLLHLGIKGLWARPRFVRASPGHVAQYAHTPEQMTGEENEWELLHSLKELEHALHKVLLLVGVRMEQVEVADFGVVDDGGEKRYAARGRRVGAGGAQVFCVCMCVCMRVRVCV